MTTAAFTPSGTRIYRQADRLAGKSFFRTLLDRFVAGRQFEADMIVARVGVNRWCDSTERLLLEGLSRRQDRL